ncbi:hypothetical protein [Leifsonia aquatica]|uniref:Bacterial HORMA domain-containing protein n=2 Tax=Leifsonia aquatica TaxID=144185 RepID=U2RQD1_LEIAQ|nr:hypothetical protein [Leifsonia aquatica]ERK71026.1 hypothetical protein N136_02620 [Leifsonia aquatica ATCC 14665]MBB2965596.1 hypothetical protein [Leifsonia aquatica]
MTGSYSVSQTFTLTHAKHLASKVVSDLYQCRNFYGEPSETMVTKYQDELIVMLAGGFTKEYEFGFKKNDQRVVSWQYRVNASGDLVGGADDRSGGIYARADISGAVYFNFMSYSPAWFNLTPEEQNTAKSRHPISRSTGHLPSDGSGYWHTDRTYGSAGVAIDRKTFRPV